jgi:SSS family solute:Na+ symporter
MDADAVDLIIIILYFLLMLYMGYKGWKMSRTSADYLLAGRRLGMFMYTGCLAAVVLGGASTVGGAKLGYQYGISGFWMVFMIGLGIMALGVLLTTKLASLRIISISELLELRYDRYARLLSAIIMSVYAAMISVIQVIAIGTILSAMVGWKIATGMLVGGMVVLIYTFLGGMWSVSLTDFIQFALMTTGIFFLVLPLGLIKVGGWRALAENLPSSYMHPGAIGYDNIFAFFLLFFLGLIIGQDVWQRVFTANGAAVARRGTIIAGAYCMLYAAATVVVGMVAAVKFPGMEDPQMAFATVAVDLLPPGVTGLVLAGSLSALMSTASGPLLASSTVIANDVIRRFISKDLTDLEFLRVTRCMTGFIGIGIILCALWLQDVIKALDVAYTLLSGSIFVPVFAGLFWKRATAPAALASMCLSCLTATSAMVIWGVGSTPPIMVGLGTSAVSLVAVSFLTAPPDSEHLSRWAGHLCGQGKKPPNK